MNTKDAILTLLRREELTVSELAARLGVTRNAVIVPLRQLEASKLVQGVKRQKGSVGKPAWLYSARPGLEDMASKAYPTFSELLVAALPQHLTHQQIQHLMADIGQNLAQHIEMKPVSNPAARLKMATDFVDSVGAATNVEQFGEVALVTSHSCPLARAVRRDGRVCDAMVSFFANATNASVEGQCSHGQRLRCQFLIRSMASALNTEL